MSYIDAYTVKARAAPALLVIFPLVAVMLAWFPGLRTTEGAGFVTPFSIALLFIVVADTRRAGQRLQDHLFASWGGAPTTSLLRHRDNHIAPAEKARYHALLEVNAPNIRMPTAAQEAAAPGAADRVYNQAIAWLREQTRDNVVVNNENAAYGFFRNLRAVRRSGLIASAVAFIGGSLLLAMNWYLAQPLSHALISTISGLACGAAFLLYATDSNVQNAGFQYAQALLRSLDGIAKRP